MTPGFPDPVLRVSGVSKTFDGPGGVTVLREVDLAVASGEYVTVQGRSGSGKSTLLNVLGLLDRPTEGTYELAGLDTGLLDDRARTSLRAASIGFVFQAFHLLDDRSALENVMMGLLYCGVRAGAARTEALDALQAVGMAPFAARQPGSLSGGERQRVAIARALVGRPAVLLADEPTGNLDTESARKVMETFAALNAAGTTIVLITHDLEVARAGTRQLAMTDGQLAVSAR